MINTYTTKPKTITALEFNAQSLNDVQELTKCSNFNFMYKNNRYECLITLDGIKHLVIEGDFIIRDGGKISIMKPEDFNKNYIIKE